MGVNNAFSPNTKRMRSPTIGMSGASGMDGYFAMAAGNCNVIGANSKIVAKIPNVGTASITTASGSW